MTHFHPFLQHLNLQIVVRHFQYSIAATYGSSSCLKKPSSHIIARQNPIADALATSLFLAAIYQKRFRIIHD